jgi:hypothetical protein
VIAVGSQARVDDMPHTGLLGDVGCGAVPGYDSVVLAVARGDQDQHIHTVEAPDKGAAIVEFDAADRRHSRELLRIARTQDRVITVGQPLGLRQQMEG